ncbi:MAG: tetraacyldisaccharide 4'-kinase [bacterium JZ-2024 1]
MGTYPGIWHRIARQQLRSSDYLIYPFLLLMEKIYDRMVEKRRREARARMQRFPIYLISVGNLTVGGSGKTLVCAHLAQYLEKKFGKTVGVLLSGYGGTNTREKGAEMVQSPDVKKYGDEAVMLWEKGIAVWVAKNREKGIELMVREGMDVAILDDGFQYWSLHRDVDVVCWDTSQPFWEHRLPAGPCREKWEEMRRANAILLMRTNIPGPVPLHQTKTRFAESFPEIPFFEGELRLATWQFSPGERILAVSGIAHPQNFETLLAMQGVIVFPFRFPDHHHYTRRDVQDILQFAKRQKLDAIVTTEKDFVKLRAFTDHIFPLRVEVEILPEGLWHRFWETSLSSSS